MLDLPLLEEIVGSCKVQGAEGLLTFKAEALRSIARELFVTTNAKIAEVRLPKLTFLGQLDVRACCLLAFDGCIYFR